MKKLLLLFLTVLGLSSFLAAQDPAMEYLKQQCPQLTDLYQKELKECHAHYIFAIDVSLSMCKYESAVEPALAAFVEALPSNDCVTIIPFAKNIISSQIGFNQELTINAKSRESLREMVSRLYPTGAEKKDKKYFDTDIYEAQKAVTKSIQMNKQYDVNIIVFISDLLHCPANNIDRQFNEAEMAEMHNLMKSAKHNSVENMVFTLELPQSGKPTGYVYPQLQELYRDWDVDVDQKFVPSNSENMIRQWFDQQKKNIMFRKLQTIIIRENKANPIVVKTDVDIDGNVKAHIEWKKTKLYPKIELDSTYILNSDFYFKPNKEYVHFTKSNELNADLDLGQIKHKDFGFHMMNETIHFDVKLPVEWQNEIDKLLEGRPGALANTTVPCERMVFTFIFPLWFTITLIVLLILYIIGVFKALARNGQLHFNANVIVYDREGEQVGEMRKIRKLGTNAVVTFGKGGSPAQARVDGAEWQFEVKKKRGNPFLVFQKPRFEWKCIKGYCANNKAKSGKLSYDGPNQVSIQCGTGISDLTHRIMIKLTNN